MITRPPAYKAPVIEDVRCLCRRFYRIFSGEDYQLLLALKEALEAGAIFMDARTTPFFECECGQVLDFAPECSLTIQ
jgi:hypothetical protein